MTARKLLWLRLAVLLGAGLLLLVLLSVEIRSVLTGSHVSRRALRDEASLPPAGPSGPGWPHRRGPQYNAVSTETDLADSWPPEGPPVLWIRDLGCGYSGLTAVGNRLFTQIQSLTSQMVACLEADSGANVWQRRCGWPFEPGGIYPGPRATPTWHDGRIYFAGPRGLYQELARCEVFSGEICWTAPSLHRGRLYLRSPSKAACIYLGKPGQAAGGQLLAARPTSQIPRSSRFDLTWFVGGEREYAFDPADVPELKRWYWFSLLGVLAVAAIAGAAVDLLVRIKWPARASGVGRATFWSAALVCGVLGTPVYNRLGDHFIFTWPVCLFAAHQLALNAIAAGRDKSQWRSFSAAIFFLAVCLVYFLACRRLSLAIEWIFLLGFLPSWPIAVPAAYQLRTAGHLLRDFLWTALGFSAFFWAAGGLMLWKTAAL